MNLTNLRILARAYVPQAKLQDIDNDTQLIILNEGVLDVALRAEVLKTNDDFNSVAEQQEYDLKTVVTRFLRVGKAGCWYKQSGGDYKKLYPRTQEWLDENIESWRECTSASSPIYYYIEGDKLGLHPKPDASTTDAIRLFFTQRPTPMTGSGTEYPFGGATEITQYAPFSDCVLNYWAWRAKRILNNSEDVIALAKQQYLQSIEDVRTLVGSRRDIQYDKIAVFKGARIP